MYSVKYGNLNARHYFVCS